MNKKFIVLLMILLPACTFFDSLGIGSDDDEISQTSTVTPEGYMLNIWLSPVNGDSDQLAAAKDILEERLLAADMDFEISLTEDEQIRIRTNETSEDIVPLVIQVGLLEIVDFTDLEFLEAPQAGACILTDVQLDLYAGQTLCPTIGAEILTHADGEPYTTILTGEEITATELVEFNTGWAVQFQLSDDGSNIFGDFTEEHIGEVAAIVLDGKVFSTPYINARINGEGVIEGNFTQQEAENLATILSFGRLPLVLEMTGIKSFPEGDADYHP